MFKGVQEAQNKVFRTFVIIWIAWMVLIVVLDEFSSGLPVLPTFSAADIGTHASLKERKHLSEPIDMQFYCAGHFVFDTEVKPLAVSLSIGVDSHVKVILKLCHPGIQLKVLQWQGSGYRSRTGC